MIKVKNRKTGDEFEVPNEHWEEVLSQQKAYEKVVIKRAGRPRKKADSK